MLDTNNIYKYYCDNLRLLSYYKRFHFASRMAAWYGYQESYDLLKSLKPYMTNHSQSYDQLLYTIYHSKQTGRRNAHETRQPFFDKYPSLFGAQLALFRVRHLKEVYGIDTREELFSIASRHELIKLRDDLLSDDEALKILSTFAVNYCYLLNRAVLNTSEPLPLETFLEVGKTYDLENTEHMQLFIYLYTHCIIGESDLYASHISDSSLPVYQEMLEQIESLIRDNYQKINLDNKLEFLVCARICNYQTDLFETIHNECQQSISPKGEFVIDTLNDYAGVTKQSLASSEHRNILLIMSASPYSPHPTLVS